MGRGSPRSGSNLCLDRLRTTRRKPTLGLENRIRRAYLTALRRDCARSDGNPAGMPAVDTASASERVGTYAALQASAEIGIGTMMHAFHIPFGGHVMSLNQGFLLSLAARGARGHRAGAVGVSLGVSGVAAALKPLSPAGNRLGPMLAIAVQGLLYSMGLGFAGANVVGAALGLVLLSLWGFAQPLILAYLIFGRTFFEAIEAMWRDTASTLGISFELGGKILLGVILVKAVLAVAIALCAWWASASLETAYRERVRRWAPRPARSVSASSNGKSAGLGALRDLSNRWFVASLLFTLGFLSWTGRAAAVEIVWYAVRAIVAGWVIFWAVRWLPVALHSPRVRGWLKRFPGLARAFETASKPVR